MIGPPFHICSPSLYTESQNLLGVQKPKLLHVNTTKAQAKHTNAYARNPYYRSALVIVPGNLGREKAFREPAKL